MTITLINVIRKDLILWKSISWFAFVSQKDETRSVVSGCSVTSVAFFGSAKTVV